MWRASRLIEFNNDRVLTMANSHNHLFHQFFRDGYLLLERFLSVIDLDPIIEDIQEGIENTLKRKCLPSEKKTTPSADFEKRLYWLEN